MSPDAIKNSICNDCYHCERDRKQVGVESIVDCRCEFPQYRHQFGHVRTRVGCPSFFRQAVLLETEYGCACLLPTGA